MSVMASYNEIDGVPSHASRWLLTDVLRGEWAFDGTVVSDYYAIRELHEREGLYGHHLAADGDGAAALAVRAGVNLELPEPDCYQPLADLAQARDCVDESADRRPRRPVAEAQVRAGALRVPLRRRQRGRGDRGLPVAPRPSPRGGAAR